MAQFPSLPLWTDAYLADTGHLTDAEHGVYLQLLMHIWRSPECRIPNDDKWIARKFRRSEDEVVKTIRPLVLEFCNSDGNWITQGRLKDEWTYCRNRSKSQSARAKSRWDKEKDQCPDDADTHKPGSAPFPIPTPTPLSKGNTDKAARGVKQKPLKPIPSDWNLTTEGISKGRAEGYTDGEIRWIAESFVDHWNENGERKRDWHLTWCKWVKSPYTRTAIDGKRRSVQSGDGKAPTGFAKNLFDGALGS